MPLYEYKCTTCHEHTEKIQKFSDPEITVCPHCGGHLERVLSAPAVSFKGGGWYADGYGSKKASSSESKADEKSAKTDSKSEQKSEQKTESTKSDDSKKSEATPGSASPGDTKKSGDAKAKDVKAGSS